MAADHPHPGHYLRDWRKANGLTLEQAADRVERASEDQPPAGAAARAISMTHATLSRIERGKLPYNQVLIELLAKIYKTDCASLLMRRPNEPESLWSIWEQLRPVERVQALEVMKALQRTRALA